MSCIHADIIAMRQLGEIWFVKNLKTQQLYEFDGALSVLWDCLLNSPRRAIASQKFLDYFDHHPEAKKDLPTLFTLLEKQGLILHGNEANKPTQLLNGTASHPIKVDSLGIEIQNDLYAASLSTKRPVLAEYELSYVCNLRCAYCYQPHALKSSIMKELTKDEITHMLKDFAESGVFFLSLTGGECTLSPNFLHTLEQARKNYMDITVLTNGSTIDDSLIQLLQQHNVSEVKVSIYGASEEEYLQFTTLGNVYNQVMTNIQTMKDAGLNVIAKIIVTSFHEKTYKKSLNTCQALHIPTEISCHVMPSMTGGHAPLDYRVSNETLTELMSVGYLNVQKNTKSCTAGTAKFRVSPDGIVTACELIRQPLGNIRNQKILDILSSSTTIHIQQTCKNALKNNRTLNRVWAQPCPALSKLEHNDWNVPSKEAIRWTTIAKQVYHDK